jgi:hypothetical protein
MINVQCSRAPRYRASRQRHGTTMTTAPHRGQPQPSPLQQCSAPRQPASAVITPQSQHCHARLKPAVSVSGERGGGGSGATSVTALLAGYLCVTAPHHLPRLLAQPPTRSWGFGGSLPLPHCIDAASDHQGHKQACDHVNRHTCQGMAAAMRSTGGC